MAYALLPLRGVRPAIFASIASALAACSSGSLNNVMGTGTSPGTVTLRLDLPSTTSFCDPLQYGVCFDNHISIRTPAGQMLEVDTGGCSLVCSSQCVAPPCTDGICVSGGHAITQVEKTWDGSYYLSSTCGQGLGCVIPKFVLPAAPWTISIATKRILRDPAAASRADPAA